MDFSEAVASTPTIHLNLNPTNVNDPVIRDMPQKFYIELFDGKKDSVASHAGKWLKIKENRLETLEGLQLNEMFCKPVVVGSILIDLRAGGESLGLIHPKYLGLPDSRGNIFLYILRIAGYQKVAGYQNPTIWNLQNPRAVITKTQPNLQQFCAFLERECPGPIRQDEWVMNRLQDSLVLKNIPPDIVDIVARQVLQIVNEDNKEFRSIRSNYPEQRRYWTEEDGKYTMVQTKIDELNAYFSGQAL
ncbi:MAG: hypothetical protein M1834_004240 [Cirrosporium novae-zelandiae]|nr:MAG: hypothetical protein M1834_004240 [Cirrosporium novae-zelandiae]